MKKNSVLIVAGLLLSFYGSAQLNIIRKHGGNILNDSTVILNGLASSIISDSLYVINAGSSITVDAKRDSISEIAGSDNYFCWSTTCFAPSVNTSKGNEPPALIGSGDTNKTFYCDYSANGTAGASWIRYVFFSDINPNDSSWVIIEYNATISGIQGISGSGISISAPYPNPASHSANLNYSLTNGVQSANLKILNLLGECIQTLPLSASKRTIAIDVQSIPSGIYVCEIESAGCKPVYQKLLVAH